MIWVNKSSIEKVSPLLQRRVDIDPSCKVHSVATESDGSFRTTKPQPSSGSPSASPTNRAPHSSKRSLHHSNGQPIATGGDCRPPAGRTDWRWSTTDHCFSLWRLIPINPRRRAGLLCHQICNVVSPALRKHAQKTRVKVFMVPYQLVS